VMRPKPTLSGFANSEAARNRSLDVTDARPSMQHDPIADIICEGAEATLGSPGC
jgi:hypothetical protein